MSIIPNCNSNLTRSAFISTLQRSTTCPSIFLLDLVKRRFADIELNIIDQIKSSQFTRLRHSIEFCKNSKCYKKIVEAAKFVIEHSPFNIPQFALLTENTHINDQHRLLELARHNKKISSNAFEALARSKIHPRLLFKEIPTDFLQKPNFPLEKWSRIQFLLSDKIPTSRILEHLRVTFFTSKPAAAGKLNFQHLRNHLEAVLYHYPKPWAILSSIMSFFGLHTFKMTSTQSDLIKHPFTDNFLHMWIEIILSQLKIKKPPKNIERYLCKITENYLQSYITSNQDDKWIRNVMEHFLKYGLKINKCRFPLTTRNNILKHKIAPLLVLHGQLSIKKIIEMHELKPWITKLINIGELKLWMTLDMIMPSSLIPANCNTDYLNSIFWQKFNYHLWAARADLSQIPSLHAYDMIMVENQDVSFLKGWTCHALPKFISEIRNSWQTFRDHSILNITQQTSERFLDLLSRLHITGAPNVNLKHDCQYEVSSKNLTLDRPLLIYTDFYHHFGPILYLNYQLILINSYPRLSDESKNLHTISVIKLNPKNFKLQHLKKLYEYISKIKFNYSDGSLHLFLKNLEQTLKSKNLLAQQNNVSNLETDLEIFGDFIPHQTEYNCVWYSFKLVVASLIMEALKSDSTLPSDQLVKQTYAMFIEWENFFKLSSLKNYLAYESSTTPPFKNLNHDLIQDILKSNAFQYVEWLISDSPEAIILKLLYPYLSPENFEKAREDLDLELSYHPNLLKVKNAILESINKISEPTLSLPNYIFKKFHRNVLITGSEAIKNPLLLTIHLIFLAVLLKLLRLSKPSPAPTEKTNEQTTTDQKSPSTTADQKSPSN